MTPIVKKVLKGITQKAGPDIRDGLSACENLDLVRTGSALSLPTNEQTMNYGSVVHSLCMEGLLTHDEMLAGVGTSLYRASIRVATDFSGEPWEASALNGIIYIAEPTNGLYSWNGSQLWKAGAPPVFIDCTPTDSGAAGVTGFDGDYVVYVTYTNANGYDGLPTDGAAVTVAAGNTIDVTAIQTYSGTDYNITGRKLWIQGGTTPSYPDPILLLTISDNTTTQALGIDVVENDAEAMQSDNYEAPVYPILFENYGVMFLGYNNTLRYSKTLAPEQWPLLQNMSVSRSGDPLMAGCKWNGAGWVATRKRLYQIIGSPGSGTLSTNFYIKESSADKGTIARRSFVPTPHGIFYEAEDGIYLFNGATSVNISDEIQEIFWGRNLIDSVECLSVGAYLDGKYYLSFAYGESLVPNKTVVYDIDNQTWTTDSVGWRSFAPDRKTNLLYGGTASGIERIANGSGYRAWSLKQEFCPAPGYMSAFASFRVKMIGTCTANVYYNDVLQASYTLSRLTMGMEERKCPPGLAERMTIELVGGAAASQSEVSAIMVWAEPQGRKE